MAGLGETFYPPADFVAANNLAVALELARAGLKVFPCIETLNSKGQPEKRPYYRNGDLEHGKNDATCDPDRIKSWWNEWPRALPAIACQSGNLVVIDADRHGGPDGVAAFEQIAAKHGLPAGPIVETQGGGLHYIFTQPENGPPLGDSEGKLTGKGINVRGSGYIIAPRAMLGDYRSWSVAEGSPSIIEALAAGSIPPIPDWLATLIRTKLRDAPAATEAPIAAPRTPPGSREEAAARAALDGESAKVRKAPPGDGNIQLYLSALKMGSKVGAGWISRGEVESALAAADIARGGRPRRERDATIKSGIDTGEKNPSGPLSDRDAPRELLDPKPRRDAGIAGPTQEPMGERELAALAIELLAGFTFDGEGSIEPPPALVKRLVPLDGICFIGGQSGAGKTFLAIYLAVCLASGEPFFGYKIKERVGVAIFAPEGASTIPLRLHVARNEKAQGEILPIAWLGTVPNLKDKRELSKVIAALKALDAKMRDTHGVRLGAIIFDTLVASFDLDDEDDNSEAAKTIRIMKAIGEAVGAVVIPVHHYGKGQETGLRGASGWRAGCDVVLSVLADRNQLTGRVSNRKLALAKSRVGEEGEIAPFELRFVHVGVDEDGDDYGSCVVDPLKADAAQVGAPKARLSRVARAFMEAFQIVVLDKGERAYPFGAEGSEVKAVDREDVRAEFYRSWPADGDTDAKKAAAKRKAFNRGASELCDMQTLCIREVGARTVVWAVREDKTSGTDRDKDNPS